MATPNTGSTGDMGGVIGIGSPRHTPGEVSWGTPLATAGGSRLGGQLARFAVIGVVSTVVNLGLFAVLHAPLGSQLGNVVALLVATVLNTAANRWWTFEVRGADGIARHHLQSLTIFAVTWAFSSGALALLAVWTPHASTAADVLAVAAANLVSTVVRFIAMRTWIFRS